MLNSGSPRYKRLGGGEHLESRLLPKSIGICVSSSPPPTGPHLRLWRSQQQVRIPTPQLTHIGPPPLLPQPAAGVGGLLLLPPSCPTRPRTGVQLVLPLLRRRARVMVWHLPLPSTEACSIVGGGVAAQKENKA